MQARVFGVENEYGFSVRKGTTRINASDMQNFIDLSRKKVGRRVGQFLENGCRFYLDVGCHPEYATAEGTTPDEVIGQDRAGELIVCTFAGIAEAALSKSMGGPVTVRIVKNNADTIGNLYGCHENYLVERDIDLHQTWGQRLIPFLITRPLLVGSGRLVTRADGEIVYQLAQRILPFAISAYSTERRGYILTRDEPHADAKRWRRLQIIGGDANLCDYSTFLKLASTCLVLRLIETRPTKFRDFYPEHLESAAYSAASRHDGQGTYTTTSKKTVTALGVQRSYLDRCKNMLDREGGEPWEWEAIELWGWVLDHLTQPDVLAPKIDWAAKYVLLCQVAERNKKGWQSPRIGYTNLNYHELYPELGYARRLEAMGKLERRISDAEIAHCVTQPPSSTRAVMRALYVDALVRAGMADYPGVEPNWSRLPAVADSGDFKMPDPFLVKDPAFGDWLARVLVAPKQPGAKPAGIIPSPYTLADLGVPDGLAGPAAPPNIADIMRHCG